MSAGLFDRIMDEATYNRNLLTQAYAGDLADLLTELQLRAERAEAALAKLREESNALCNHILDDSIFGCESNQPCVWNRFMAGDDSWYVSTTCRETMYWNSGDGPDEEHKFCPYCGCPLRLVTSDNDLLSAGGEAGNE